MNKDRILKHLNNISENIKNDKIRLNNIVNILNTGKNNSDINDKLIETLTNMEFDNTSYSIANEYISIIFTNMQTQKLTYNKEVTEELIKILNHNLSLLDSIENCLTTMNVNVDNTPVNIERRIHNVETEFKRRESDIEDTTLKIIIKSLIPTSKISNSLFWLSFVIAILSIAYIIDKDFYKDTAKTTTTISKAIHNNGSKKITKGSTYE